MAFRKCGRQIREVGERLAPQDTCLSWQGGGAAFSAGDLSFILCNLGARRETHPRGCPETPPGLGLGLGSHPSWVTSSASCFSLSGEFQSQLQKNKPALKTKEDSPDCRGSRKLLPLAARRPAAGAQGQQDGVRGPVQFPGHRER